MTLDFWRSHDGSAGSEGGSHILGVPGTDHWYVVWMMAGAEGYSELTVQLV